MEGKNTKITEIINAACKHQFTDEIDEVETLSYTDKTGRIWWDRFDYIDTTKIPCSVHFIGGTRHSNFSIPLSQLTEESINVLHSCIDRK